MLLRCSKCFYCLAMLDEKSCTVQLLLHLLKIPRHSRDLSNHTVQTDRQAYGTNLVAAAKPLFNEGLAKWSSRF